MIQDVDKKTAHPSLAIPKHREGGFTIIEMIVVLAIIGILSAMFVLSPRSNRDELALQQSGQLVIQAIDRTRNNELGNKKHAELGTSDTQTLSAGGHGVYLKEGEEFLIIFADCNADLKLDRIGSAISCKTSQPLDPYPEIEETILLKPGVRITDVNYSSGCADASTELAAVFRAPYPRIWFDPALPAGCTESSVVLQNNSGTTLTIVINQLGVASKLSP